MARPASWASLLLAAALLAACGGATRPRTEQAAATFSAATATTPPTTAPFPSVSPPAVTATPGGGATPDSSPTVTAAPAPPTGPTPAATAPPPAATPVATPAPAPPATPTAAAPAGPTRIEDLDYLSLVKLIPGDDDLPDRVSYAARFDLSNEKAAGDDQATLKRFRDAGRVTGIQTVFRVQAGARSISLGVSYYDNPAGPRELLRQSGDPADHAGAGRFTVPGLGDEYIARRLQLGSGEAAAHVINLAWVRGNYFVSLADLGGTADTPTEVAVGLARQIDEKLEGLPQPVDERAGGGAPAQFPS
ncbi:MAG: hypothetical protein U0531_08155 [Dehalococcoidia bacterium]